MMTCWIILIIGILLFVCGIVFENMDLSAIGVVIIAIIGFGGFLIYANLNYVREDTSIVPIAEIVRTKSSIMIRPEEKDAEFIVSKDYATCSAKDKDIYLLKINPINHYNQVGYSRIEIRIREEKETQPLEKKE